MEAALQAINGAVTLIVPEVILLVTMCVAFVLGPFLVTDRHGVSTHVRSRWGQISIFAIAVAASVWWQSAPQTVTSGPFRMDDLVWYTRLLSFSIGTVLSLLVWSQAEDRISAECQACLLAILAGANLTAAANDLITLFLALELVSIPTYVLLYLPSRGTAGKEATLKYFLLSVFSSALLMFGFAYLYGVSGTTNLDAIRAVVKTAVGPQNTPIVVLAMAMIIAGLSFRITAVPFHFYAPDVFQGVAPVGAAMLSIIPKVVGFVALFRVMQSLSVVQQLTSSMAEVATIERTIVAGVAVMTMFVGNLLALRQRQVARMMAYSSIAHAGYMLVGFAVIQTGSSVNALSSLLFYLATYGIATVGVFSVLVALSRPTKSMESLDDFSGLSRVHPLAALMLAVLLFGLTGLPPTAGFLGKMNLFLAAWSQGSSLGQYLAIAIAINAAISAWYYLRLISVMFLQPNSQISEGQVQMPALVGTAACAALTLGLFVAPNLLWQFAERAGALVR